MTHPPSTTRRLQGDEGSVLAETALLIPIIIMMLAGIVDFGVGYRDRITMSGALRGAARQEAVLGPALNADRFTLTSLWGGLNKIQSVTVNKVIVYKTNNTGVINALCSNLTPLPTGRGATNSTPVGATCNVYSQSQMQNAATTFTQGGTTCAAAGWDHWYCPATRSDSLTSANGPDYLGIYIDVTYTPFTRIFRSSINMTDKSVIRLEPAAA